jgi:hypothetical protein
MQIEVEDATRRSSRASVVPAPAVLPVYAATLFVSAGLLFVVEPMISKMALPQLGGSPNVWNTCLFFFQATLLLSYTYAHGLARVCGRTGQIGAHAAVVVAAVSFALPLKFAGETMPSGPPVFWLLGQLAVTVGPVFFAIAATAPLLQRWFSQIGHPASRDPYFLYGASNLGSLLALIAYPLVIEPNLSLDRQSELWSKGFALLLLGLALSAVAYWTRRPINTIETVKSGRGRSFKLLDRERLSWIGLAFVPSSLLLGVTAHITTDIAATPLFWVIPLALYLLSFVLAFARRPLLRHEVMVRLLPILLIPIVLFFGPPLVLPVSIQLSLYLGSFFVIAMICHGELVRRRPDVVRLTEFYFFLALGGLLGGLFNAILAPVLFPNIWEYPLLLIVAGFGVPKTEEDSKPGLAYDFILPTALFAFLLISRTISTGWLGAGQPPLVRLAGFGAFLLPAIAMMTFRRRRLRFALSVAMCLLVPELTSQYHTLSRQSRNQRGDSIVRRCQSCREPDDGVAHRAL